MCAFPYNGKRLHKNKRTLAHLNQRDDDALIKAPYHDTNKQTLGSRKWDRQTRKEEAPNKSEHRQANGANIIWENRLRQEQSGSGKVNPRTGRRACIFQIKALYGCHSGGKHRADWNGHRLWHSARKPRCL